MLSEAKSPNPRHTLYEVQAVIPQIRNLLHRRLLLYEVKPHFTILHSLPESFARTGEAIIIQHSISFCHAELVSASP
ncbi:MAG: hypothetical protein ACKO8L_02125, partial [Flavobacterium sp.]